jgi:arsenite methyltransferase
MSVNGNLAAEAAGDSIRETVRQRYAEAALSVVQGSRSDASGCCGTGCGCGSAEAEVSFGSELYEEADRAGLPDAAVLASLGCGNPIAVADLREGETVLDLGSGGGIDVLLSAQRVGSSGRAIGIDMTDEMLELARRNAAESGARNVEFLKGTIEAIPLAASSVDVVISNCVVNLAADKDAVFKEIARVLRPTGRIGISDVVARDGLTPDQRAERGSYVGCIAGALSFEEYEQGLRRVGFDDIAIHPTHQVADGMFAAIIRARRTCAASEGTKGSAFDASVVRL